MTDIMRIIRDFKAPCACGFDHHTAVRDVRIGSGLVHQVGGILKENGFTKKLLVVYDDNTIRAAEGIFESLSDFDVEEYNFHQIRVAKMEHVRKIEDLIRGREISVLAVGSGSVDDPCRLAAANQKKQLCLFATAPSMDGFASYSSPIVDRGFKASYPAKSPEVIIGDTKILAAAPAYLKSAGFGDMIAKYVGLVDWKISHILTGELYCERVADLTRKATDEIVALADKVTVEDEKTAGMIFGALLKTGLGMSFMQNSRPASGAEHVVAHLLECLELPQGKIPNFHGEDVGVATLAVLKYYNELAAHEKIRAKRETVDWDEVYKVYGPMADDVRKLNTPTTIADDVAPEKLVACWQQIREVIRSVPSYDECLAAMKRAGCRTTVAEIGKTQKYFDLCMKYSPYMRRRLTLLRLSDMILPQ